jgi:hypothetical protein
VNASHGGSSAPALHPRILLLRPLQSKAEPFGGPLGPAMRQARTTTPESFSDGLLVWSNEELIFTQSVIPFHAHDPHCIPMYGKRKAEAGT